MVNRNQNRQSGNEQGTQAPTPEAAIQPTETSPTAMALDENPEGVVERVKVSDLPTVFSLLGKKQKNRDGTADEWEYQVLVDDILRRGFRPEAGPEMVAFRGEQFVGDGNTRCAAVVEAARRNPALAKITVPIRFYPESTPEEKREEIRIRAVRMAREWTRADWVRSSVAICLSFPGGNIPEKTFVEKVGIERFRRQYPSALVVEKDETGHLVIVKIKNRQAIQSMKRLAYDLPSFCTDFYVNRLRGVKPGIGDQDLTTLSSDWKEDLEAHPELSNAVTFTALESGYPDSKLLARLATAALEASSGDGRKKGSMGAMRADDLKSSKATFGGGDLARIVCSYAARDPGLTTDEALQDIKALDALVKAVMTDPNINPEKLHAAQSEYSALTRRIFERQSKAVAEAKAALALTVPATTS